MSDIVKRLPPLKPLPDCMMPDGAQPCIAFSNLEAEIERLRAETDPYVQLRFEAEIERLQAQLEERQSSCEVYAADAAAKGAEIERLTEVLQDCQSRAFQQRHELTADIGRLRAKVKQLEDDLRDVRLGVDER